MKSQFKFVGATLIPHITKITTQRQSVWENLYALIFYQKWRKTHGRNKCNNDSRGNAG